MRPRVSVGSVQRASVTCHVAAPDAPPAAVATRPKVSMVSLGCPKNTVDGTIRFLQRCWLRSPGGDAAPTWSSPFCRTKPVNWDCSTTPSCSFVLVADAGAWRARTGQSLQRGHKRSCIGYHKPDCTQCVTTVYIQTFTQFTGRTRASAKAFQRQGTLTVLGCCAGYLLHPVPSFSVSGMHLDVVGLVMVQLPFWLYERSGAVQPAN